jgi:hypothetical protein
MQNNKIILCLLLLLGSVFSWSQQGDITKRPQPGEYSFLLYLNGGAGYYASQSGTTAYNEPSFRRINPIYTARLVWHPDHLLSVGLESGFMTFYSYKLKDSAGKTGSVALDAIPMLIVWSMPVKKHFNILVGSGLYILKTALNYQGKTYSNKLTTGWMAGLSYIHPIKKNLGLGTEFKWLYASETTSGTLSLQLEFIYRFLNY